MMPLNGLLVPISIGLAISEKFSGIFSLQWQASSRGKCLVLSNRNIFDAIFTDVSEWSNVWSLSPNWQHGGIIDI